MTADADRVETFIFSLTGTTFHGLVCGRCDDPSEVFRIVEGRIVDAERVTFVIEYDEGGPLFAAVGPYRASVTGTVAGNRMALLIQREGATGEPQALTLRRVVEDGVSVVERGTP